MTLRTDWAERFTGLLFSCLMVGHIKCGFWFLTITDVVRVLDIINLPTSYRCQCCQQVHWTVLVNGLKDGFFLQNEKKDNQFPSVIAFPVMLSTSHYTCQLQSWTLYTLCYWIIQPGDCLCCIPTHGVVRWERPSPSYLSLKSRLIRLYVFYLAFFPSFFFSSLAYS